MRYWYPWQPPDSTVTRSIKLGLFSRARTLASCYKLVRVIRKVSCTIAQDGVTSSANGTLLSSLFWLYTVAAYRRCCIIHGVRGEWVAAEGVTSEYSCRNFMYLWCQIHGKLIPNKPTTEWQSCVRCICRRVDIPDSCEGYCGCRVGWFDSTHYILIFVWRSDQCGPRRPVLKSRLVNWFAEGHHLYDGPSSVKNRNLFNPIAGPMLCILSRPSNKKPTRNDGPTDCRQGSLNRKDAPSDWQRP